MVQAAVTGGSVEFVFRTWPARPGQLRRIRAEVRGWLATLRRLSERAAEDIVVVVSEAASNTVEHAYDADTPHATVEVTFWTEPGAICIEVVDHGRWRPPDRAGGGRGFLMMHRLVDAVVIRYGPLGTRVLLRHPLPGDALELPVHRDQSISTLRAQPDDIFSDRSEASGLDLSEADAGRARDDSHMAGSVGQVPGGWACPTVDRRSFCTRTTP